MTETALIDSTDLHEPTPGTVRRVLQRQIMPLDKDYDVLALYVDPEEARLDADKYEIGGNRAAKDLNNAAIRQTTSTGRGIHPEQIESRTAMRVKSGELLLDGALARCGIQTAQCGCVVYVHAVSAGFSSRPSGCLAKRAGSRPCTGASSGQGQPPNCVRR